MTDDCDVKYQRDSNMVLLAIGMNLDKYSVYHQA